MSELTKEHFEQVIQASEKRIVKRIDEAQSELARIVADTIATPFTERFDHLEQTLNVRDQVQRHEKALQEISKKMGLHFEL